MPIPTYQAAGTVQSAVGQQAVSVSWPTHQTDDIAILIVVSWSNVVDTPSGWTAVTNGYQQTGTVGANSSACIQLFWRRATSSAMGSTSILAGGSNPTNIDALIVTFRGCVATGDPFNATAGGVQATSSSSVNIGGVTTTVGDCLIVAFLGAPGTASSTSSWADSNLTNVTNQVSATAQNLWAVTTGVLGTAGASGTVTATLGFSKRQAYVQAALMGPPANGFFAFL